MPREIFLDQIADAQEAVQVAVSQLEAGEIVCLPDESGWNLAALAISDQAATRLQAAHADHRQPAVSLPHPSMVHDYLTDASKLFSKLSARCWPGPVVLRSGTGIAEGLARQWPAVPQGWALNSEGRAFYCPADSFCQEVLRAVSAPILSLLGPGHDGMPTHPDSDVSVVIRAPRARFSETPTVVSIQYQKFQVERKGVVSKRMLDRLAGEVYLFVCTGNTCRSPMAEALFRRMLADRLDCREDELLDHGYVVLSAGLAAYKGALASPDAVTLLREDGIDLSTHESQPLTEELLLHCDHVYTMTRSHREAVVSAYPELAGQVRLLSAQNQDIPDPIGAGLDEYVRCKQSITLHLQRLLDEIDFSGRKGASE